MIGTEPFPYLHFADIVLLTEMLLLALQVMNDEAKYFDLVVSWYKTKIQTTNFFFPPDPCVPVAHDNVEVVESFMYLGVVIRNTGSTGNALQCHNTVCLP